MYKSILIAVFTVISSASGLFAGLRVAATVPNMGMLARKIGGDKVEVTVMTPSDRDAHYLDARPSMMAALRRADLLVAVGAELEIGWLPSAIKGANNPRIQTGRPGYFEGAAHVELIEKDKAADRSRGDVHPAGNPHFDLCPEKMVRVAIALGGRMARLDSDNASYYRENAEKFADQINKLLPRWKERVEEAPGSVTYHGDANYLIKTLDVPFYGHIEVLPGIPPTASHLRELVRNLKEKEGVVIHIEYQPSRGADFIGRQLNWPVYKLPAQVRADADAGDYFNLIDRWVAALLGN